MSGDLPEAVYLLMASRTSAGSSSNSVVVGGGVTGVGGGSVTDWACTRAGCGPDGEDTKRVRMAAHPARSAPVINAMHEQEKASARVGIQQAPFDTVDYSLLQVRFATHTPSGLRCRWSWVSSAGGVSTTCPVASHCVPLRIPPPFTSRSTQRAR